MKQACRERVCADDWQRNEVQAANQGHFSPYLQRRIDAAAGAKERAVEPMPRSHRR